MSAKMCEAEVELNTQEVRSGQWTEEAKVSLSVIVQGPTAFVVMTSGLINHPVAFGAKQYQFLLRIILQLKDDRETISWSRINMPGRTTKSLQNQWTKVQKQLAELDKRANTDGGGEASPKTPKSTREFDGRQLPRSYPRTDRVHFEARKRRTKKSETDEKTEEGGNGEQDATRSKKRASAGEQATPFAARPLRG